MKNAVLITEERRAKQIEYNKIHNITPTTTKRELDKTLKSNDPKRVKSKKVEKLPAKERQKIVLQLREQMLSAAKKLEFEEAARLRDEIEKMKTI